MSNIIALIWDFDKTLINGNMQEPIFEKYGVDPKQFWNYVDTLPDKYMKEQGVKVNPDTIYLNAFIKESRVGGMFEGLNNKKLREFGNRLKLFNKAEEFFRRITELSGMHPEWSEYDIKIENYIISTGFAEIIKGSKLNKYVDSIWGCEIIEDEDKDILAEIGYTIDNTTKTRAIFEINKGVNIHNTEMNIDVNSKIDDQKRRVQFKNMIYIADGPSDVPAFSVINRYGGSTFAVYPKGNKVALKQVEQLRLDGRINMYAIADYDKDSTASEWILNKIEEYAERIINDSKEQLRKSIGNSPKHSNY